MFYIGKVNNVVVIDDDLFFRDGLVQFLKEFFQKEYGQTVLFEFVLNDQTVRNADVIVKTLVAGGENLCIPALRPHYKGLLISVCERSQTNFSRIVKCIENGIVITRFDALREIEEKIKAAQSESHLANLYYSSCRSCRLVCLSHQQLRVIERFSTGKPVQHVARELNIKDKTVFAHKYQVMMKFGLHSDYELLRFYNSYRNSNGSLLSSNK